MRLEYMLHGLNYPCTIEWYYEFIDERYCMDESKYTFSGIDDFIRNLKAEHFVYEFKQISSTHYKIAIVYKIEMYVLLIYKSMKEVITMNNEVLKRTRVNSKDLRSVQKYVDAYDKSNAKCLTDVYYRPSQRKEQAFNKHLELSYKIRDIERTTSRTFIDTAITSFNTNFFTCVTLIVVENKEYDVYIISLPSATYVYYTTGECYKITDNETEKLVLQFADVMGDGYPNLDELI